MKILLIGNYSSWMKLHLEHVTAGFRKAGCDVIAADYHKMERWCGLKLGKWEDEYRQRELEKLVKIHIHESKKQRKEIGTEKNQQKKQER